METTLLLFSVVSFSSLMTFLVFITSVRGMDLPIVTEISEAMIENEIFNVMFRTRVTYFLAVIVLVIPLFLLSTFLILLNLRLDLMLNVFSYLLLVIGWGIFVLGTIRILSPALRLSVSLIRESI